ncbi:MAG: TatD family hydrolase [Coriobacteriales bacterium]|jgi:TatD DNase family protein|nr:TatD family hydrolase [Coriobacteriales bacterium]
MRKTDAAASNVANHDEEPEQFFDAQFRDSKGRVVAAPDFAALIGPGTEAEVDAGDVRGSSPGDNAGLEQQDAKEQASRLRIADTHCHLDMLHHPELSLARCAVHGVDYLVSVVDPTEDPAYTFGSLANWLQEAAKLLSTEGFSQIASERLATSRNTGDNPAEQRDGGYASDSALCDDAPGGIPRNDAPRMEGLLPDVHLMIGCHPHNAKDYNTEIESLLIKYAKDPRTVAVGEIGLDYYYDQSPRQIQREVFARQLELAQELNLPVALHLREAHDEGFEILERVGWPEAGCLLHCYTLGPKPMQPFLERGCYLAFGGTLTFKKAEDVRAAAIVAPLERIVTETDAPFMTPHPLRGTVCGPEHTIFTAALLAELHSEAGIPAGDVLKQLYTNARVFFGGLQPKAECPKTRIGNRDGL